MGAVLKDGTVVSEEQVSAWAAACEDGDFPGTPGKWVVRPAHRPTASAEPLVSVSVRLPVSLKEEITQHVKTHGGNLSSFMRDAAVKEMLQNAS